MVPIPELQPEVSGQAAGDIEGSMDVLQLEVRRQRVELVEDSTGLAHASMCPARQVLLEPRFHQMDLQRS